MGYGLGGQDQTVQAVCGDGVGATISAGNTAIWTFGAVARKVIVSNHPDSAAKLYIVWNAAATGEASLTNWDAVLSARDYAVSPDGILIKTVDIYTDVDMTDQTNVQVRGWV